MGRLRGRPRRPSKIESLSNSTVVPLASSSPVKNDISTMEDDEFNKWLETKFISFRDEFRTKFEDMIKTVDVKILNLPFDHLMDLLQEDNKSSNDVANDNNKENNSAFKVPMGVPKARKRGHPDNTAGASKSVHFELASSNSTNDSLSDSDVFKTPPKKGCSIPEPAEKKFLKTPVTSRKEPFAVVTPGPMMNKSVQVLRLPQAGETAVSLSGSPLLVTPFGANGSSQALLTLASDNGRVMTIVQPDGSQGDSSCSTSPTSDSEMFSLLNDDAKQKIKQFASYLLNSIK